MRITLDLQATQTEGSHNRGVGRYSESFARSLIETSPPDTDVHLCLNGVYADTRRIVSTRLQLSATRGYGQSTYVYPKPGNAPTLADDRRLLSEALVRSHWLATKPDVLHVSHLGEGFRSDAVVPRSLPAIPGAIRSATLYDLIPLRFPEFYLVDPAFERWYMAQLDVLRQCDLLLAISESSRRDAIELLGAHPDSVRTIWGGIDAHFTPARVSTERAAALRHRLGIDDRFILYTGGDDHRKNLGGAIEAFGELPSALRRGRQLVIVCSMQPESVQRYLAVARLAGLGARDVVLTGFVDEADLVDLYRLCELFVFPSWYEGFGLPVIEAMACGAPAIGGRHSSVREIIDHDDALFDAHDKRSIAAVMARVLTDAAFAQALKDHGLQRAQVFTWSRTARIALDAFDDALARKRPSDTRAITARARKRKLAYFSPLPPCKSGIADHSALLLRHLSKFFEIELFVDGTYLVEDRALVAAFPIHSHERFEELHERFDGVMYEMGNSEFHAHMLPLLEKYPGIVTLHDAYISGLFGYLEFNAGEEGRYMGEMVAAHGPRARRFFAPVVEAHDPVFNAMVAMPCTKRILDQAIGLIAHSPFNIEVSRAAYPRGWRAPFRIVRQLVSAPTLLDATARAVLKRRLGFADDDLIIATFGHVAWNKSGDTLLEAFRLAKTSRDRRVKLVFVGALSDDAFGAALAKAIASIGERDRVRVTGFVDDKTFADYLAVSDMAFQLRKSSRGGTPKGVLDCMAASVPVVLNAEASYLDYPDDALIKLPAEFDASLLAATIDTWTADQDALRARGRAGREYVLAHHHPTRLASDYACVIDEFIDRQEAIGLRNIAVQLAACRGSTPTDVDIGIVTDEVVKQASLATIQRRRLFIDVSHLDTTDHGTGIPRVVRSIVTACYLMERADVEPVAVVLDRAGHMHPAVRLLERFGLSRPEFGDDRPVEIGEGDMLLMLDSSWARWSEFEKVHEHVREAGGTIVTALYDLLPLRLPHMMVAGGPAWFEGWLQEAIASSDAVVCISRAVADDLHQYIDSIGAAPYRGLKIGYWHLGADFSDVTDFSDVSAETRRAVDRSAFLMVGTIEPRKRHGVAIDAFERLWSQGDRINLVIMGRPGWMTEPLLARLRSHAELGKRLHLLTEASDTDLQYAYRHATALLFPSAGEGFGLPLIEAAHHGLPVIANDLPVLREIGGDSVSFVDSDDAEHLAQGITSWIAAHARGETPDVRTMEYLTWSASAAQLLDVVVDNHWYRTI